MAIGYNTSMDLGWNGGSGNLNVTYTVSSGANRLLVVALSTSNGNIDDMTGVTYNGVSLTQAIKIQSTQGRWAYLYYLLNPASGANSLVVSTTDQIAGTAADYTGVAQAAQPDATASGDSGAATGSFTQAITVGTVNSWVMGTTCQNANTSPAAGAGETSRITSAFLFVYQFDSNADLSTGSHSFTTTNGSQTNMATLLVSFKPSVAAPVSPPGVYFDTIF